MITKGSLPFAADNDQVRAEHERDSHYRRESALLQAATASTLVRGVQALRLAQLNLSHQHYLTRLWFLRSGFSLNGPNLFVGIGRVKLSTEAIEIATAFLCYELRWFEVDNLVDGARTLRFADLPWPHEGALVSRVLGGAHSPMQVSDFPTEPNNFLRFLLHPQRTQFYGITTHELGFIERRIWDPVFFQHGVLGKVHEADVDIVLAAHTLLYSFINGSEEHQVQGFREKFLARKEEWIAANINHENM